MKPKRKTFGSIMTFACLATAALASSCSTYYCVSSQVSEDLSVKRTIYSSENSYEHLQEDIWKIQKLDRHAGFNFHNSSDSMKFKACAQADEIGLLKCKSDIGNPILCPEESLGRKFRWFFTQYEYKAVFKTFKHRIPLAYDGYLTEEEMSLLLRGSDMPKGWNGTEIYGMLDEISRKFAQWYSDAVYITLCDIFRPYCDERQIEFMETAHDAFMTKADREEVLMMTPKDFVSIWENMAPEMKISDVYSAEKASIDKAYETGTQVIEYFFTESFHTIDLPGKYAYGNAVEFMDGNPVWKVDAYRLLYDDMILKAASRKVNIWAFLVTFAIIAAIACPIIIRRRI